MERKVDLALSRLEGRWNRSDVGLILTPYLVVRGRLNRYVIRLMISGPYLVVSELRGGGRVGELIFDDTSQREKQRKRLLGLKLPFTAHA